MRDRIQQMLFAIIKKGNKIKMDVKEKLVELLQEFIEVEVCDNGEFIEKDIDFDRIAESLIANGVTVQEWIPVDDRLPEIGRSIIAYNAPAKCAAEAMYKGEGKFLQFRWSARLQEHEVTHWMPLPDPPKEE